MSDTVDLTGHRFGRLVAVMLHGRSHGHAVWMCRCDCGAERRVVVRDLRRGHTKSCGCLSRDRSRKHGLRNTPAYESWFHMISRCENPKHHAFADYGARGIKVHEPWHDIAAFVADVGERPQGTEIDRIDNNGNYEPGNVRWATVQQQARNRRSNRLVTAFGETLCVAAWAERTGLTGRTIIARLNAGRPVEQALTEPSRRSA